MADKKISDLPALTLADITDVLPLVDVSASVTKKITVGGLLALLHPVGSLYMNANVSTNPGTLLGFGTWAAFGAGRVPVGIDATQTEFDVAEETGGAKTHTLTIAEMPSHNHAAGIRDTDDGGSDGFVRGTAAADQTGQIRNTGGGGAHNNLQPYIVVYMWKRTA